MPLGKLVPWEGNVRKTGAETGIDELAASIAAHGLINPLTVRPAAKGKFAVIAGQRRLLALKHLAKGGHFAKDAPVSCHLAGEERDAAEISLAENVVRVAMHPADQFEAWQRLTQGGADTAEIAARFGVTEATVRKRLALARVAPSIFALYRAGEIDLDLCSSVGSRREGPAEGSALQGRGHFGPGAGTCGSRPAAVTPRGRASSDRQEGSTRLMTRGGLDARPDMP